MTTLGKLQRSAHTCTAATDNDGVIRKSTNTSLLAEILLQKYEYHVPFYRQIQQYRHLGMKGLTESTLDGWFKKTVELLRPLYEELKKEVFSCDYGGRDYRYGHQPGKAQG